MRNRMTRMVQLMMLAPMLLASGCTSEKAEALKVAAQQFQKEASLAIAQTRQLLLQTVIMVAPNTSQTTDTLEHTGELDGALLNELITGVKNEDTSGAMAGIESELSNVEAPYIFMGQTFDTLSAGRLFTRDAVKQSEVSAAKLTAGMVHLAKFVQIQPGSFHGRRAVLIGRFKEAKAITDDKARRMALESIAADIHALSAEELAAKNAALAQCFKAAEAGKALTTLIRDYNKLSLSDMLRITGEVLHTAKDLSYDNKNLGSLVDAYDKDMKTLCEDPYWKPLLKDYCK